MMAENKNPRMRKRMDLGEIRAVNRQPEEKVESPNKRAALGVSSPLGRGLFEVLSMMLSISRSIQLVTAFVPATERSNARNPIPNTEKEKLLSG